MRVVILIISILLSLMGCNHINDSNVQESKPYFIDSLVTNDTLILNKDTVYDKAFVLEKLGSEKFNLLRSDYKQNLYKILEKFEKVKIHSKSLDLTETITQIKKYDISVEQIKNSIPISPTEFKIYDSCFSNNEQQKKIVNFEKILFELTCNSSNGFAFKEDLIVLYVDMYSYMYQGALLNETRVGDGYYYYAINTLICRNNQLFCENVWAKTNELVKSKNNDLYNLYDCRCLKKVLDEFDLCE